MRFTSVEKAVSVHLSARQGSENGLHELKGRRERVKVNTAGGVHVAVKQLVGVVNTGRGIALHSHVAL